MEKISLPLEEPALDEIHQAVLDTRRLTFEDETTVRRQLDLAKPISFIRRASLPCVAGLVLGAGGCFFTLAGRPNIPADFRQVEVTFGKVLLGMGAVGTLVVLARKLLDKLLVEQVSSINQA